MNPVTASRRHYEDLAVGEVVALGRTSVTRDMIVTFAREFDPFPFHLDEEAARASLLVDMIVTFAREFDPFPFHLDEEAAKASLLGGLASSGWQTAALSLRMLVDGFLNTIASMGGLGFSDLKWKKPVMVGDTISGSVTIAELRRSKSRPDRGIVTLDFDIRNQKDEPVMSMRLANLVELRDPSVPSESA